MGKFRRCFYEMCKDLLEEKKDAGRFGKPLGIHQVLDVIAFIGMFRVLFIAYVMYRDYQWPGLPWYDFRHYDVAVSFLYTFRSTVDHTTFLMVYFFAVIFFFLEWWCFRLDVRPRNWRFWYQATVATLDDYRRFRLNESQLKKVQKTKQAAYEQKFEAYFPLLVGRLLSPVRGTLTRTFASLEIFTRLEGVDVEALQSRPPPLMPLLPWHIRAKVLKVMLFTEVFAYWFQLAIVLLYLMAMAIFIGIYPHWAHHPWYMKVFEAYEMCWPLAFLLLLVRYVVFFTAWTGVGSVAFTSHLRELQAKVSCWLKQQQQQQQLGYSKVLGVRKLQPLPPGGRRLVVERFLREHNLVCFLVVSCSGQLFGKVILGTICTQIPINVIFVRKMVLGNSEETPFSLRLLLFVFCFAQLLIFASIFLPLAWCQKVYHSPKKFIPRLMLLSSSGSGASWWWRLRLKYNDLYGRLLRGPKFAISVGELHAVTYFSSMEFLFSYIAYLLMAFSKKNVI